MVLALAEAETRVVVDKFCTYNFLPAPPDGLFFGRWWECLGTRGRLVLHKLKSLTRSRGGEEGQQQQQQHVGI